MKSEQANASFPFIRQETTRSEVQSYGMKSSASEQEQSANGNIDEAEENDSDEEKSSSMDIDEEEAESDDSEAEKSSIDGIDERETGDDAEEGNLFARDAAPTTQEALKELLATVAKRPARFEAMSVFQEIIEYKIYQPFDTIQPFDAGRTKYYVSPMVRALKHMLRVFLTISNEHRLTAPLMLYIFITRYLPLIGTHQTMHMLSRCRCIDIRFIRSNPSFS